MGGRGQNYKIIVRLTNFRNAYIPRHKLTDYILNPSKSKSKAELFQSMGYNMTNHKRLEKDILAKLRTNQALKYQTNENGDTEYQVNMLLGITKKKMIATGWIIRKGEQTPQFVTAYQNHKLKPKER